MKVIIWEPSAEEMSGKLGDDFSCIPVNSEDELFENVSKFAEVVLIVDIDLHGDSIFALDEKINQELTDGKDIKKVYSSESNGPEEFKSLQKNGLLADALLKRPHEIESLKELIQDLSEEFVGTESTNGDIKLEVTSSFSDKENDSADGDGSLDLGLDSTTARAFEDDLSLSEDQDNSNSDEGILDISQSGTPQGTSSSLELGVLEEESEEEEFTLVDSSAPEQEGEVEIHTSADIDTKQLLADSGLDPVHDEDDLVNNDTASAGEISVSDNTEDSDDLAFELSSDDSGDENNNSSESNEADESGESLDLLGGSGEITTQTGSMSEEDYDDIEDQTALTEIYDRGPLNSEKSEVIIQAGKGTIESEPSNNEGFTLADVDDEASSVAEPIEDILNHESETNNSGDSPIHFHNMDEIRKTIEDARESEEATEIMGSRELKNRLLDEQTHTTNSMSKGEGTGSHVYEQIYKEEILKLKATIENLRQDREDLIEKDHLANQLVNELKFRVNGIQAELDEAKIELGFIRKKYDKEKTDYTLTRDQALEKRDLLLAKNEELKKELDLQNQKVKFDIQKAREREKVLEGQLELLKSDSESLIKSRDKKILELKRSIDSMQFDLETLSENEKRTRLDKVNLEEKLNRIMSTLRRTIGSLDEEILSEKVFDQDKKLTEI